MPAQATTCVICHGALRQKLVTPQSGLRILACEACGLWVREERSSKAERLSIYDERYYDSWGSRDELAGLVREMKRKTFDAAFRQIARLSTPGRLLDVGCAFGASLEVAQRWGWDVYGLEVNPAAVNTARETFGPRVMCGDFESAQLPPQAYDAVLLWDLLEHLPNPVEAMRRVHRLLKPGGLAVINTPCTQSLSARMMKGFWPNLKAEHLFYLSRRSMSLLLEQTGFQSVLMRPGAKVLNLLYVDHILRRYEIPGLSAAVRAVVSAVPRRVKGLNVSIRSGDLFVVAKRTGQPMDPS